MKIEDSPTNPQPAQHILVAGHVIGLPVSYANFTVEGVARIQLLNGRTLSFDEPEIVSALQRFFGYAPPTAADTRPVEQAPDKDFPELKDQNSEFFKSTAALFGTLKAEGVPEARAMVTAAKETALDFIRAGKMKPTAADTRPVEQAPDPGASNG